MLQLLIRTANPTVKSEKASATQLLLILKSAFFAFYFSIDSVLYVRFHAVLAYQLY